MNQTEKTVIMGAGLVALAILGGSWILANQLDKSLRDIDLWQNSGIPNVAKDVHTVISPIADVVAAWTRAGNH